MKFMVHIAIAIVYHIKSFSFKTFKFKILKFAPGRVSLLA